MASVKTLRKSALESCTWHGHSMGQFHHWPAWAWAQCQNCGAMVHVESNPPNGIDIAGDAISLNCLGSRF